MIIRALLYRKLVKSNKAKFKINKEILYDLEHVQKVSEEELLKEREYISNEEEQMIKFEKRQSQLCIIADIALYSVIAQFILLLKGFELGVIIAESISLFAMIYGFVIIKNLARYLYLPLAIMMGISMTFKIILYLQ